MALESHYIHPLRIIEPRNKGNRSGSNITWTHPSHSSSHSIPYIITYVRVLPGIINCPQHEESKENESNDENVDPNHGAAQSNSNPRVQVSLSTFEDSESEEDDGNGNGNGNQSVIRRAAAKKIAKKEFNRYMEHKPTKEMKLDGAAFDNPLVFWFHPEIKNLFPFLSIVAIWLLCIPATSAGVERLFSLVAAILRKRRRGMKPDTLKALVELKRGLELELESESD
eukprot:97524_1